MMHTWLQDIRDAGRMVRRTPLVALTTKVSRHRVVRGHRVRFSGKVRPAIVIPMVIQKRGRHGLWRNIATTVSTRRDRRTR